MLLIDEHLDDQGERRQTFLEVLQPDGGGVAVRVLAHDLRGLLPVRAVEAVMRRYGRPLDVTVDSGEPGASVLDLGDGRMLQHWRYRAPVDASARDYLVWHAPGQEPLAALSNGVAAALRHLANAMLDSSAGSR